MPDVLIEPTSSPRPEVNLAPAVASNKAMHPAVLSVLSAVALWFAFPPAEWGWLAWVALVPLFGLVTGNQPKGKLYLGSWLGGFVFWMLSLQWVSAIDPSAWAGWLAMAFVLSLGWPLFLWCARRGVSLGVSPMIATPVAWVGLESLRTHILSGFPWYFLAHSQYKVGPLIQISDFAGSLGLSFLIALVNALICDLSSRETVRDRAVYFRTGIVGLAVVATLVYGAVRISTANFKPGPRIALLQSNLLQRMKSGNTPDEILGIFRGLIDQAMKGDDRPDLIIWPETAYPYSFVDIDPQFTVEQVAQAFATTTKHSPAEWTLFRRIVDDDLRAISAYYKVPMLIGISADRFDHRGASRANAVVMVDPDPKVPLRSYQKIQLVPFGEYIPMINTFPFLTALVPYPAGGIPNLAPGQAPAWFDVGPYRYAPLICFEDTIPHLARRFFSNAPEGRHPDVLVNVTNDGWFRNTSEQQIHLAVSVFRAVENRVPLARAVNTGISAMIDGNGAIVASLAADKSAQLTVIAPLDDRTGLYSILGDWVGLSCLAACALVGPLSLVKLRQRPRQGRTSQIL